MKPSLHPRDAMLAHFGPFAASNLALTLSHSEYHSIERNLLHYNAFSDTYCKLTALPNPPCLCKPNVFCMDFMISVFGENTADSLCDQLNCNVFLSVYHTIANFNTYHATRVKFTNLLF